MVSPQEVRGGTQDMCGGGGGGNQNVVGPGAVLPGLVVTFVQTRSNHSVAATGCTTTTTTSTPALLMDYDLRRIIWSNWNNTTKC